MSFQTVLKADHDIAKLKTVLDASANTAVNAQLP